MFSASLPARSMAPSTAHPFAGPRVVSLGRPLRDHRGLRAHLWSVSADEVVLRRAATAAPPEATSARPSVPKAPAPVARSPAAGATALVAPGRRWSQSTTEAGRARVSSARTAFSLRGAHGAASAAHVQLRQAVADALHGLWRSPCKLALACGLLAAACASAFPSFAAAAVSQRLLVCAAVALAGLFTSVLNTSALRHLALARGCGVFAGTVAGLAALATGLGAGVAAGIATGAAAAATLAALALCAMSPVQRAVVAGLVLVLLATLWFTTPAGAAWLATRWGSPADGARHAH